MLTAGCGAWQEHSDQRYRVLFCKNSGEVISLLASAASAGFAANRWSTGCPQKVYLE